MAFKETSNTIVIDAVFTELGRKKFSRGKFNVVKFALGDDEIDYAGYDPALASDEFYSPRDLVTQPLLEAYSDASKNIQYGLMSYTDYDILYLPVLKINQKVDIAAQTQSLGTGSYYYLSVNNETTTKINEIQTTSGSMFNILTSGEVEKVKLIVESGLDELPELTWDSYETRNQYLVRKTLLDQNFFILADNRFFEKVLSCTPGSKFRNFPDGKIDINFESLRPAPPTSYPNQFDKYVTFLGAGVSNYVCDHDREGMAQLISSLAGPRGTVTAFNMIVSPDLRINSSGNRSFKYEKYGKINQVLFDEVNKFDYIDSPVYVIGTTSNSRINVPLRIIRYAGT